MTGLTVMWVRFRTMVLALPISVATFWVAAAEDIPREPEPPAQTRSQPAAESRPVVPDASFTPREKLPADSAVSFPVDI